MTEHGSRSVEQLVAQFEACTLPPTELGHRQHIEVAWWYLQREPLLSALARFCRNIERFATAAGAANKYNETITCAFMLLIHERMRKGQRWEAFANENRDLLEGGRELLAKYYLPTTLGSDRARRAFALPDCPL